MVSVKVQGRYVCAFYEKRFESVSKLPCSGPQWLRTHTSGSRVSTKALGRVWLGVLRIRMPVGLTLDLGVGRELPAKGQGQRVVGLKKVWWW